MIGFLTNRSNQPIQTGFYNTGHGDKKNRPLASVDVYCVCHLKNISNSYHISVSHSLLITQLSQNIPTLTQEKKNPTSPEKKISQAKKNIYFYKQKKKG